MKRAIFTKYNQLNEKLTGYVAMMNFRYLNLCVKAEEVSLLSIMCDVEGEVRPIEEVADIVKKNDYQFMCIPKVEEDLLDVAKGVTMAHPEFKQKVEKLDVEVHDEQGNPRTHYVSYILLTMPEVNDDRYDLLTDAVKLAYNECKALMEAANQKSQVEMLPLEQGEKPEELDQLHNAIDKLNDEKNSLRDKVYEEKIKEIEEAHNHWLANESAAEKKQQEKDAARGSDVVNSMRMGQDEDE